MYNVCMSYGRRAWWIQWTHHHPMFTYPTPMLSNLNKSFVQSTYPTPIFSCLNKLEMVV